MMIFKKVIPRRTFLRGAGATLALPLLDAMVPAFAASADISGKPVVRLAFIYVPIGVIIDKWTPASEGAGFKFTPILEPLAGFRDRLLVLTGLDRHVGGNHAGASAAWLTGVEPKESMQDLRAGISADQIAAKELGKRTPLASLELTLEDGAEFVADGDGNYSAAYTHTISWRSPTTRVPMENKPRAVFERIFGDSDSTDRAQRLAQMQEDRSVLDSLTDAVARLMTGIGVGDRTKLTEYLDSVRDIERRIQVAEEQGVQELPVMERPADIPPTFEEHAKLMFDLQVLAYQGDVTRVISFMMSREKSNRVYHELGITEPHHPLSHHRDVPAKIADLVKINTYHARMLAYFLGRLQSTPDGDGSLLDHSVILYGSGLGDGNLHTPNNVPTLLVGGGAGQLKGGRHLRYSKGTPLTNLHLTMLDVAGIPVEKLGDSTGKLELLSTL